MKEQTEGRYLVLVDICTNGPQVNFLLYLRIRGFTPQNSLYNTSWKYM